MVARMTPEFREMQDRLLQSEREIRRLRARMDEFAMGGEVRGDAIGGVLPPEHGGTGVTGSILGAVTMWLNNTGGVVAQGTVVVEDGNRTFNTTTTSADRRTIGVCDDDAVQAGANARIRHAGYQEVVLVQGAVGVGDYLLTGSTAGRAVSGGTTAAFGIFAIALTAFAGPGAGQVSAYVFPIMDGGGGVAAGSGGTITVKEDGSVVLSAATSLDFLEPDAVFITPTADEANFNMALYALLSGRAGGQILRGGTAAGEDLQLLSTANAAKGEVQIGAQGGALGFRYDEVEDRAAIGGGTILHTISGVPNEWKMEAHSQGEAFSSGFLVHRHAESESMYGQFSMMRSRGVHAGPSAVLSGDTIGQVDAFGYDGSDYEPVGAIRWAADAAPGLGIPGRMSFYTTPEGGAAMVERIRIDKAGVASFVGSLLRLPVTTKAIVANTITIAPADTSHYQITGPGTVNGIAGGSDGMVLLLSPVNDTDTVTLAHNTGTAGQKFFCAGGTSITQDDIQDFALAIYKQSLDSGSGGWMVGTIGGGSASGGHTIQDDGVSLLARSFLNFTGPLGLSGPRSWNLMQAIDNPGNARTDVYGGYKEFDCIVDANQYTAAAWNIPVYSRLEDARIAGHRSVRFISSNDASPITILNTDAMQNIQGDTHPSSIASGAAIPVNLTVQKDGLILDNLSFDSVAVTMSGLSVTMLGCRLTSTTTVTLSGSGASMIACSGVGLTAATAITVSGTDNRVQACGFRLCATTVATIGGGGIRPSLVGNIFQGSSETGYFIDVSAGALGAIISGNSMTWVATALGAINCGLYANISGNLIVCPAISTHPSSGLIKNAINNASRTLITGNLFLFGNITGIGSVRGIMGGNIPGLVVQGNAFIAQTVSTSGSGVGTGFLAATQCDQGGLINSGNLYAGTSGTNSPRPTAINVITANGAAYIDSGNIYVGAQVNMARWIPVANYSVGTAFSAQSLNKLNSSGFADIRTYQYDGIEDFDTAHLLAAGVDPPGWARVIAGGGAITYPQDVQGGEALLATGAAANADTCLYLDSNVVIPLQAINFQFAGAGFESAGAASVAGMRVRIGLCYRAMWAGMGAAAALPGAWTDYFLFDYDSGVSANWRLRMRAATGAEVILDTTVPAVATFTTLMAMASLAASSSLAGVAAFALGRTPAVTIAGGTYLSNTVLLAPGIYIESLDGAAKEVHCDVLNWGSGRA